MATNDDAVAARALYLHYRSDLHMITHHTSYTMHTHTRAPPRTNASPPTPPLLAPQLLEERLGQDVAANDEAVAARALYLHYRSDLHKMLRSASHGHRLQRLGCEEDIKYCAELDLLDVVPVRTAPHTLTKHV